MQYKLFLGSGRPQKAEYLLLKSCVCSSRHHHEGDQKLTRQQKPERQDRKQWLFGSICRSYSNVPLFLEDLRVFGRGGSGVAFKLHYKEEHGAPLGHRSPPSAAHCCSPPLTAAHRCSLLLTAAHRRSLPPRGR
ncbi:hypothetical protein EYF80_065251 [Liparis tanakae]|uniref:Uncharacterized protein n=1 Tax=Liparis tanakae TaxID=230148 RepID=A0A4Z2E7K0_9TELE|nr:hypothetical protein EYF80_065251 [Liparis tanakae]